MDTADIAEAVGHVARVGGQDPWESGPDANVGFHSAVVATGGWERRVRVFVSPASSMGPP